MDVDRVLGGLIGVALGDALGVPHEFSYTTVDNYTGVLEHRLRFLRRFQTPVRLGVGQVSDDTEMTLALARSLVEVGYWDREDVAMSYMKWANGATSMGRNTRALFKGVTTYQGFQQRCSKIFGISPDSESVAEGEEVSQSNGSLMRAFPLACVAMGEVDDAMLTNPTAINLAINRVHVQALRMALRGRSPQEIWDWIVSARNEHPEISDVIRAVEEGEEWELNGKEKGWVVYGFYAAMWCLYQIRGGYDSSTFSRAMHWVIKEHPGSDTDTNAAITGGMLGAIIGWDMMKTDPITLANYEKVRNVTETDVSRPAEYRPEDLEDLATALAALSS